MNGGNDSEVKKGKTYCLRLLSLRPRSEREIELRLKGKGYSNISRKELLDQLKKEGLVNDREFARQWVDSRLRSSPKGKRFLRKELLEKGVSGKVIDKIFSEKISELDERKIADGLIRKKLAKSGIKKDLKLKGKLYRYLLQRGIEAEIAEEAVNEAV
jgi:regulatory protein